VVSTAQALGETVVLWDFECVLGPTRLMAGIHDRRTSSEDSLGVDVSEQRSRYAELLSQKPSSILSLEHETLRTYIYPPHFL
jgi:hypothetical protein